MNQKIINMTAMTGNNNERHFLGNIPYLGHAFFING